MQHEDFNSFLLWSCDIPKAKLCGVVEVALDFATSTGLGEVQGILPHLPLTAGALHRVCCVTCDNTNRFNSQRAHLDAGALVDPAPFSGVAFVGLELKDTAALVVLQEILCKTGLRHRAHFQKRMFMTCPHSFLDSKSS